MNVHFRAACAFLFLLTGTAYSFNADAAANPEVLIKDGKIFGEMRYRYEHVDQDGIANNANAHTIRTNLGFKTGVYKDFQGLIEGQIVKHLGNEDFNSLDNGKVAYPVVVDPDVTQINRAWIEYTGLPDTSLKIGRQAINLDNQRFVGTVNFRQNDQTFDAGTITNTSIDKLSLQYGYIANVNRIFDGSTPPDDLDSLSHIVHASYHYADWLKLAGYGYWLDFDNAAALSSKTFGARITGQHPIDENWSFLYEAEIATQQDHGDNAANYNQDYLHLAPAIKGHGLTLKLGYEELGGDGTNAFQTPLATGHKFNGWADKFLTTPVNGLEDRYIMASYKFQDTNQGTYNVLNGTTVTAFYHDFDGDKNGDYGSEIDLSLGKNFMLPDAGQPFKTLNVVIKYADYDADDGLYTDTEKLWVQFGIKF